MYHNQTSEHKDKQKSESSQRKMIHYLYGEKQFEYVSISSETMEARKQWHSLKELSRIPRPAKISLRNEGEIKTFSDKRKLMEFVTSRPALKERLKKVL